MRCCMHLLLSGGAVMKRISSAANDASDARKVHTSMPGNVTYLKNILTAIWAGKVGIP